MISGSLNFNMLFIQEAVSSDSTAVDSGESILSFFDLLLKGGFWLVPLVILWLIAIYIYFETIEKPQSGVENPI
jgi:biopolymer transport protein ExbB